MTSNTYEARDAEYIANGGSRCPNCGSSRIRADDIQADDIVMDDLQAWQGVMCHDCNATWVEVFNLVGISNLQVPD